MYHLGDLVGYAPWPNEVVVAAREARHRWGLRELRLDGRPGLQALRLPLRGSAAGRAVTPQLRVDTAGHAHRRPRRRCAHCRSASTSIRSAGTPPDRGSCSCTGLRRSTRSTGPKTGRTTSVARWQALAGLKDGDVIAFGHTHLPWHRVVDGIHFVNTGSVGRPKDGDARAGYSILDIGADGAVQVQHVRVAYDVSRAAAAIRAEYAAEGIRDVPRIRRQEARLSIEGRACPSTRLPVYPRSYGSCASSCRRVSRAEVRIRESSGCTATRGPDRAWLRGAGWLHRQRHRKRRSNGWPTRSPACASLPTPKTR